MLLQDALGQFVEDLSSPGWHPLGRAPPCPDLPRRAAPTLWVPFLDGDVEAPCRAGFGRLAVRRVGG